MPMARSRPRWLAFALCFWAGILFSSCGDADKAPSETKKIVKGKVPAVQKTAPATVAVSGSQAAEPGKAAAPVKSDADTATPQAVEFAVAGGDDDDRTPMEKGLAAAAKLERLLLLDTQFSYDPADKIDPFEPVFGMDEPKIPVDASGQEAPGRKKRVPRSPIEMVDLSQLKLTAVILAPSGNIAMVEDASGKGYVVKKGTYIGDREGRVTDILPDRLIVTEQGIDDLGKPISEIREIQIPKPPGEI
jgi:type IV pilus assembly protein PilP